MYTSSLSLSLSFHWKYRFNMLENEITKESFLLLLLLLLSPRERQSPKTRIPNARGKWVQCCLQLDLPTIFCPNEIVLNHKKRWQNPAAYWSLWSPKIWLCALESYSAQEFWIRWWDDFFRTRKKEKKKPIYLLISFFPPFRISNKPRVYICRHGAST